MDSTKNYREEVEKIIDILVKHGLTIADLGQKTSLRTAAEEIQSLITQSNKEVEKKIWDKVKKEYVHIAKVNWSKFPPTIDEENLPQPKPSEKGGV